MAQKKSPSLNLFRSVAVASALLASYSWGEESSYVSVQYAKQYSTGYIHSAGEKEFLRTASRHSFTKTDTPVPGKYSMQHKAGPVEDQGQCGSCWDFSLTSVLRGTYIMAGHDSGRLSFNYLLNCATDMMGCNGGDFTAAAWFQTPKGAPAYGSDGDYNANQGSCLKEKSVASIQAFHMLGPNGTGPSFKDIAYVVGVLHRPVSIDVAVDDNWQNYSSGVYNGCSDEDPNDINHMVSIEGYDCGKSVDKSGNCVFDANGNLPNGKGVWIIRNSWGEGWGENGYIRMAATDSSGKRCNAVANDALYYDLPTTHRK